MNILARVIKNEKYIFNRLNSNCLESIYFNSQKNHQLSFTSIFSSRYLTTGTNQKLSKIFPQNNHHVRYLNTTKNQFQSSTKQQSTTSTPTTDQELIYYGPLTPRIRAVKVFSLTTSIVGLSAQPMLVEQGAKLGGTPMVIFLCTFAGFFTFVTPLFLHFITKKYVTEIHYDRKTNEYTATTISLILLKKQIKFKVEDVVVPEVPGMFTAFKVGKTPLFVDSTQFTDSGHYIKMMGYDKPIDFKIDIPKIDENINLMKEEQQQIEQKMREKIAARSGK